MFAAELNRRVAPHGIRTLSVHPGAIFDTNLAQYIAIEDLLELRLAAHGHYSGGLTTGACRAINSTIQSMNTRSLALTWRLGGKAR